jgi:hypothetical protein
MCFGTVVKIMRGPILATQVDGTKLWQAVLKIFYDDEDIEQLNRLEIIAARKSYRWNASDDTRNLRTNIGPSVVGGIVSDDEGHGQDDDNIGDPIYALAGSKSIYFLDPRYSLLDSVKPTTNQK